VVPTPISRLACAEENGARSVCTVTSEAPDFFACFVALFVAFFVALSAAFSAFFSALTAVLPAAFVVEPDRRPSAIPTSSLGPV